MRFAFNVQFCRGSIFKILSLWHRRIRPVLSLLEAWAARGAGLGRWWRPLRVIAGCDGSRSVPRFPSESDASSCDARLDRLRTELVSVFEGFMLALGPNLVPVKGCVNVRRVTAVI